MWHGDARFDLAGQKISSEPIKYVLADIKGEYFFNFIFHQAAKVAVTDRRSP